MNAYELAELRQQLETKNVTVAPKPAEHVHQPNMTRVLPPDTMVYELRGPSGRAAMLRLPDGWHYGTWKRINHLGMQGYSAKSRDQLLETIIRMIL